MDSIYSLRDNLISLLALDFEINDENGFVTIICNKSHDQQEEVRKVLNYFEIYKVGNRAFKFILTKTEEIKVFKQYIKYAAWAKAKSWLKGVDETLFVSTKNVELAEKMMVANTLKILKLKTKVVLNDEQEGFLFQPMRLKALKERVKERVFLPLGENGNDLFN